MPWKPKDAKRFTKKAKTPKQQRMFSLIANKLLAAGESEGSAIRQASGVVKKRARNS